MILARQVLKKLITTSAAFLGLGILIGIYIITSVLTEVSERRLDAQVSSAQTLILRSYQYGDVIGMRSNLSDLANVSGWAQASFQDSSGEFVWTHRGRLLESKGVSHLLPRPQRSIEVATASGAKLGAITIYGGRGITDRQIYSLLAAILIPFLMFWIVSLYTTFRVFKKSTLPLKSLAESIAAQASELGFELKAKSSMDEIRQIEDVFRELRARWKESLQRALANEAAAAQTQLASQVAHDIRSPLSALNMVTSSSLSLPEDQRLLIRSAVQRINDIANGLLKQSKVRQLDSGSSGMVVCRNNADALMLVASLDSIVSEKRVQYRDRMDVEILGDFTQGYGLFARIDPSEFARAVSNLINNSVEALDAGGRILVDVRQVESSEKVRITISDNGKGIAPEVLARLGERGLSHGKTGLQSGSGLGVYHARKTFEEAGGTFEMMSTRGVGTTVSICLPKAHIPDWFVERLEFESDAMIVSIDDDQTIHQIWSERISAKKSANLALKHLMFSNIEQFDKWLRGAETSNARFLVDYEFLNQSKNGLDVIEALKIAPQAILVTSRYEDQGIRDRAKRLGVKVLPKGLAPCVPLTIHPSRAESRAVSLPVTGDQTLNAETWP